MDDENIESFESIIDDKHPTNDKKFFKKQARKNITADLAPSINRNSDLKESNFQIHEIKSNLRLSPLSRSPIPTTSKKHIIRSDIIDSSDNRSPSDYRYSSDYRNSSDDRNSSDYRNSSDLHKSSDLHNSSDVRKSSDIRNSSDIHDESYHPTSTGENNSSSYIDSNYLTNLNSTDKHTKTIIQSDNQNFDQNYNTNLDNRNSTKKDTDMKKSDIK